MNRRQFIIASGSAPLLAQTATPAPELDWIDARKLTVEGLGFKDVKSPYDRLPGRAEGVVPAPVWSLSRDSAGALVRFTAATTEIHARWTVTNKNLAGANITAIASSGLDLYARTDAGNWRWLGIGQPTFPETIASLVSGIPATDAAVRLNVLNGRGMMPATSLTDDQLSDALFAAGGTQILVKHTASYIAAHPKRVKAPNGTVR